MPRLDWRKPHQHRLAQHPPLATQDAAKRARRNAKPEPKPASQAQLNYIATLSAKLGITPLAVETARAAHLHIDDLRNRIERTKAGHAAD